jgi:hypothetical protein
MIEPETVTVTTAETAETEISEVTEEATDIEPEPEESGFNPLLIAIPVGIVAAIGIYFAVKKSKGSISQ